MVKVVPVYGWGWSEGDSTIDTPKPFIVEIIKSEAGEDGYRALFGVVTTKESRFFNRSVILIFRSFSTYDVLVYEKLNERDIPDNWYPDSVHPSAIGFAEIETGKTATGSLPDAP